MRSKNSGTITFFIDIFFMVYKNSNNTWNNQIYTNLLRSLMRMFSFHCFGLGLMNCAVRVLNGSINRFVPVHRVVRKFSKVLVGIHNPIII